MANLSRFWDFPSLKFPQWLDEDEDFYTSPMIASGLSISEDDEHVYIEASVPGLKSDDIEVTFHKGILRIKGEREEKEEDKKKSFYREATSKFHYHVMVPGNINPNVEPEARYENGVMKVTFNKEAEEQPKKIQVKS